MPYNTRRKSLSLPSLGIHLPSTSRAAHRSPPTATPSEQPPTKKIKRSHSNSSTSSGPSTPLATAPIKVEDDARKTAGRVVENTPPPSPGGPLERSKIDIDGINDDIVVGVIRQLEKTGNRPQSLRSLAAALSTTLPIVESSANPSAIISSRLAMYLKRPWTALAPCPLAKELVGTQPKRVFYYLTTQPHQRFPSEAAYPLMAPNRIISPSLSSAADEDEDDAADMRDRIQLSPSPEVDLSSPEWEDENDPFSSRDHPPTTSNIAHNRRAQSPPLERDEREFTQTASSLQQRRSQSMEMAPPEPMGDSSPTEMDAMDVPMLSQEVDENDENAALRNSEAAAALFGHVVGQSHHLTSSPVIKAHPSAQLFSPAKPLSIGLAADRTDYADLSGWGFSELKSPEHVELDELDDLFGGY